MGKRIYKEGKEPRLFPTVKSDEDRATSIFLSILSAVEPLRKTLLGSIGFRLKKRGVTFSAKVHPEFSTKSASKDIPDGMLVIQQDKPWSALIEVKIKKADLNQNQLERYLQCVKEFGAKALITISNELCASPTLPPLRLVSSDKSLRRIAHYHWSWKYIQNTVSQLLRNNDDLSESDKFLLSEFLFFLRNPSSGVLGFTRFSRNWSELVQRIEVRGNPSQEDYESVVSDWHQESSEIAIILTEHLGLETQEVINISGNKIAEKRLNEDVKLIRKSNDLTSIYNIEGHSYPLEVSIDINRRSYTMSMQHDLPTSVKSPEKRLEHFVKRFGAEGQHDGVSIFAKWPYAPHPTDTTLFKAIQAAEERDWDDTNLIMADKDKVQYIILKLTRTPGKSVFKSNTKLISSIENDIRFFADHYI